MPCSASAVALIMVPHIWRRGCTHVAAGEVTTLEHELGDDTVELGARVAEALLARAESAEVLGGAGDLVIVEVEVDAAGLLWRSRCQQLISTCIEDGRDGVARGRRWNGQSKGMAYPSRRLWR